MTAPLPKGCKRTEVGVIPEEWEVKRIGDFTDCTAGGTPSTDIPRYWGGDIRWMSSGELHQKFVSEVEGRITEEGLRNSSTKIVPANCVLVGLAGQGKTRGTVAMNRVPLCTNQSIASIFPNDNFVPEYLFYNLENRYFELRSLSTGDGGRGGLNLTIIRNILVPFPPLPEQQEIAAALGDVDSLLAALDRLIAKKRAVQAAAMRDLLTGKVRLPGFEGEWETRKLGEIAIIIMGQSPSSSTYNSKGLGLPLIQGNADVENRQTIVRVYTSSPIKTCQAGDIVMSVRAPVGQVAQAAFDACIGRGMCAIRCKNDFLYYFLVFFEGKWAKFSKGSTFDSVNSEDISSLEVYMPIDEDEQTAIAAVLSDLDAELAALEREHAKWQSIKQGMMDDLLTGRVRLA